MQGLRGLATNEQLLSNAWGNRTSAELASHQHGERDESNTEYRTTTIYDTEFRAGGNAAWETRGRV